MKPRRVTWKAVGLGFGEGVTGVATVGERDVLPITAALRDLQRATGAEVLTFGSSGIPRVDSRRFYSVRLAKPGQRPTAAMVAIELEDERPTLAPVRFVASA